MAAKNLKEFFASKLIGVGTDRIEVRTQGCWNCIHWDPEAAAKLWWGEARAAMLARGVTLASNDPRGEAHPVVRNIREMVPKIDGSMTLGEFGTCRMGKDPNGNPLGDFVASTYLCGTWTGKVGASVAREGEKADLLPEEVFDRFINDPKPDPEPSNS